jgi:RNA polymerase sigma-70 factor (ECF subfamily)
MLVSGAEHPLPEAALLAETAWLRRLARKMVGEEDADDLVQDACVRALERPPKDASRLRGWLRQVARNAAHGRYRDRLRRLKREAKAARPEAGPPDDDVVVRAETQQRVVSAVLALGEPYRTTVLLRFFDDLPPRKVAERTGVPVATVHTRLRRGLDQLRARLTDRERSWALVLLPLLARKGRVGSLLTAGGAVMSQKAALLGAAVFLALSLGTVIWLSRAAPERARQLATGAMPMGEVEEAAEPGGGAVVTAVGRVRLRGRVVDGEGNGIPGARVDVMPVSPGRPDDPLPVEYERRQGTISRSPLAPRASATSNAEGLYDLMADTQPGDYLFARAPGFVPTAEAVSVVHSANGIEIRLERQPPCRVHVMDEGGAAVPGAHVSLLAGAVPLAAAVTDAEGCVDFSEWPRGDRVLVEHAGHAARMGIIPERRDQLEVRLGALRVVEGVVLRSLDRTPAEGVCPPSRRQTRGATSAWSAGSRHGLWRTRGRRGSKLVGSMPLEGLRVFALQPGPSSAL